MAASKEHNIMLSLFKQTNKETTVTPPPTLSTLSSLSAGYLHCLSLRKWFFYLQSLSLSYSNIDNNSGMKILQSLGTIGVTALELQHPGNGRFSEPGTREPNEILSADLSISWCTARRFPSLLALRLSNICVLLYINKRRTEGCCTCFSPGGEKNKHAAGDGCVAGGTTTRMPESVE